MKPNINSKTISFYLSFLVPSFFMGFVLYTLPIRKTFQFNNDEGIELLTSFLYGQGFTLYQEIWRDHPPFFTFILSHWLNWFDNSVVASRILVLIFTTILIWSFYNTVRYFLGSIAACVGTLLLVTARDFFKLSVSTMIGFPCIALGMLSIYLLVIYQKNQNKLYLVLSGIALALSLQIKIFTVLIIPTLVTLLLYFKIKQASKERDLNYKNIIIDIFIWSIEIAIVYGIISVTFDVFDYDQLVKTHLIGETGYGENYNINLLKYRLLGNNLASSLLALGGIISIFYLKRWEGIIPLTWLGAALFFLLNHKPVWYHHYVLIQIPLAWIAGYSVFLIQDFWRQKKWSFSFSLRNLSRLIFPGLMTILLFNFLYQVRGKIPRRRQVKSDPRLEAVNLLKKHRDTTKWIYTDAPMIAFSARLPVPPEVAIISNKRFLADDILDKLYANLQKYRPEQIVLARRIDTIKSHPGIKNYLDNNYDKKVVFDPQTKKVNFEYYSAIATKKRNPE